MADALRIYRTGSFSSVFIGGQLCLYPGGVEDCRDNWGESGTNGYWTKVTDSSSGAPKTYLQPDNQPGHDFSNYGLRIGSSGAGAVTRNPAVDLESGLKVQNANPSGLALKVTGNVQALSQANIGGMLRINGNIPWFSFSNPTLLPANEGLDSGLDGDKLDGINVTIEAGTSCTSTDSLFKHAACLCFTFPASGRHCTDLANRPI